MLINGFQKLTLLDYPEHTACTIFTGGCNYRCPFCQNASLVIDMAHNPVIPEKEIFDFLEKRKKILDGVCITGGEPLLQPDLEAFILKIKQLGYFVKLDTNGSIPDKLEALLKSNLIDYVAMDIKNSPEKYAETTGTANFDLECVNKSIDLLMRGATESEFRTTVAKELHTETDFISIGKWIKGANKYFLQQYVLSDNILGKPLTPYGKKEMEYFALLLKKHVPNTFVRGI
ncbi:MAG: anaerobic ribonucleoside-triphosphate reductase activating protein [Bacillota bacterium]|nr:anaerobic ribonucleoside-triphosphate reductase activating protein [Bacillota bacterium]